MKKIAIIVNHYPISPRVIRYMEVMHSKNKKLEFKVIAWNRNNNQVVQDNRVVTVNSSIGYGKKIKKLLEIPKFFKFVKRFIEKEKFDFIHFIDWDMLMLCNFMSTKSIHIIYEVFDMPSFKSKIGTFLAKMVEKFSLRKVNFIILSSQYTRFLYDEKRSVVVENIPLIDDMGSYIKLTKDSKELLKIGFIGTLRYEDILKNLIDVVEKNDKFELHFYGDGSSKEALVLYSKDKEGIYFHGRYDYRDIANIYQQVDYVWAAYPNKLHNVKYAVSNKFYETQIFKKPIIVSKGTKISEYVQEKNTGYSVDAYSKEKIKELLEKIEKNKDNIRNYESYEEMQFRYNSSIHEILDFIN